LQKTSNRLGNLFTLFPYELWLIIIVAFFLRIYRLGYHDLWYDEIITIFKLPNLGFLRIWNPPLYFAILAGWVKIFGFSEISLRFPSLLFSLACIPIIFLLGKELFSRSVGLYATLIMALSPFHLWYAQEARAYSMMLFLSLLSAYFQFLFITRKQYKFLYWCVISSMLGVYTHPYYIFFVIAQFICCFICSREKWSIKMFLVSLLIPLSFIPLLNKFWVRLSYVRMAYWIPSPTWKSFLTTLENFSLGYNSHLPTYIAFDILSLILFIAIVWLIKQKKELRFGLIFCFVLFVAPLLLAFIFSKLVASIYLDRGLIITTPYYYLILGLGISVFRKRIIKLLIVIFTFLLLIIGIYGFLNDWMPTKEIHHFGTPLKKPIKPIVKFISENAGPNDIIAFTNDSIALTFLWYSQKRDIYSLKKLKDDPGSYRFFFGPQDLVPSYKLPRRENKFNVPLHKINNLEFKRLWVLSGSFLRDGNLDKNCSIVKKWLDENFKLELKKEFYGMWIYRYTQ